MQCTWLLADAISAGSGRAKVAAPGPRRSAVPSAQGEVSAPAKEDECFHWAFSLDVDPAMRLKLEVLVNVQTGRSRNLDTVRHALRFHTTSDVHGITPDVVHEFVGPNDPGHHVPRV